MNACELCLLRALVPIWGMCPSPSRSQWGRVAQRFRFAKSQASPLPKLNLFNIGQRGSAIDSLLIVKIKLNPRTTTTKLTYGTRSNPLTESKQSYTCQTLLIIGL